MAIIASGAFFFSVGWLVAYIFRIVNINNILSKYCESNTEYIVMVIKVKDEISSFVFCCWL